MNWYNMGRVYLLTLKDEPTEPKVNGYACLEFYQDVKPTIQIWSVHHREKICKTVPEEYQILANEIVSDPLFEIELEKFLVNDKSKY